MKKLTLDLELLRVDSWATTRLPADLRGTVRGHDDTMGERVVHDVQDVQPAPVRHAGRNLRHLLKKGSLTQRQQSQQRWMSSVGSVVSV